jgi:osmotically-inducible protein OsmY
MNARLKLALPLMLATTAALAATGIAQRPEDVSNAQPVAPMSGTRPYAESSTQAAIAPQAVAPVASEPGATPVIEHRASHRRVEVNAPRPSDDELLRNAVMDRLASDRMLGGKVGVEAYRHTVSLTGRVTTTGQVERAESIARGVHGVYRVNNSLTARVGMI